MLQAAVDRFGWTVAGAGPVEVGQYVSGSLAQGAAEPEEFRRALEEITDGPRVPWLPSARECEIITAPNRTDRHIQRGGQV